MDPMSIAANWLNEYYDSKFEAESQNLKQIRLRTNDIVIDIAESELKPILDKI